MPYHSDLNEKMAEIACWLDLRREQGVDVAPVLERLQRQLDRAHKQLRKAKPSDEALTREPNDLEAIQALRPGGPRRMWPRLQTRGLAARLKGAWLGRAAGCTLGAPVENWPIEKMEALARHWKAPFPPADYWPGHPEPWVERYGASTIQEYLKGHIREVPVDDDVTYTVLGLLILERFGPDFTVDDVARAWLDWLPVACTAEHVALENLRHGTPPAKAGSRRNPYQEWIGADIRSDPWAFAAPGWPERAAEMAWRDAYLSHRQNGLYGAMFFAAAISAAFAVESPAEALEIGLTEIPADCRLAADIRWALAIAPTLRDWREARAAVDQRFAGMSVVHTANNACLTVFGLHLGERDFTRTIGLTVAMGLDNDCTAATVGSLLGAILGIEGVPLQWWKPFRNRTRTYLIGYERFANSDIVTRFLAQAKRVASHAMAPPQEACERQPTVGGDSSRKVDDQ